MKKEERIAEDKTRGVIPDRSLTEDSSCEANYRSLSVRVGREEFEVFLSYGFYYHKNDFSSYHSHSCYHEVIITVGNAEMIIGEELVALEGVNALVIPPNAYHKMLTTEDVEVATFFARLDTPFIKKGLPEDVTRAFLRESERVFKTGDYSLVSPLIALIMAYLFEGELPLAAEPVDDYAFMIDAFFNLRYMEEVSLESLAEYLHVSPTHAHRLMQKHTGQSFTEALARRRLKVADFLVKHRGMNITEAALAVGFSGYGVFYNARKKNSDCGI